MTAIFLFHHLFSYFHSRLNFAIACMSPIIDQGAAARTLGLPEKDSKKAAEWAAFELVIHRGLIPPPLRYFKQRVSDHLMMCRMFSV